MSVAWRLFVVVAVCLICPLTRADEAVSAKVQALLPAGARVIETADLSAVAGKPRLMVLWMLRPKRVVRVKSGSYCGDAVYGDHWEGPARLALIDSGQWSILNTARILAPEDGSDQFWLPFRVSPSYYRVPRVQADGEGRPEILFLRDLTGEGAAGQFTLFVYDACGVATTGVFGYSRVADRVRQYPVEMIVDGKRERRELWTEQSFARKPVGPGRWVGSWRINHGEDCVYHDDISFDRVHQWFVNRQRITDCGQ